MGNTGPADILEGMDELVDKFVALAFSAVLMAGGGAIDAAAAVGMAAGISASALFELAWPAHRRAAQVAVAAFLVASALVPGAFFLVPLAAYDSERAFGKGALWASLTSTLPQALRMPEAIVWDAALVAAVAGSCLLSEHTMRLAAAERDLHETRDALSDDLLALRAKNAELDEARNDEVHAAELAERTRIARSIHDSVGHTLTRLLLQVEALKIVHQGEDGVEEELSDLSEGLNEALSSMRASVHALEDTGLDAKAALGRLARESGIVHVTVACDLERDAPVAIRRFLVSFGREALTNAARHAHAEHAEIRVRSFPGMWQISCENDGAVPEGTEGLEERGMGLAGMRARCEELGGVFAIASKAGRFRVFASIPRTGRGSS